MGQGLQGAGPGAQQPASSLDGPQVCRCEGMWSWDRSGLRARSLGKQARLGGADRAPRKEVLSGEAQMEGPSCLKAALSLVSSAPCPALCPPLRLPFPPPVVQLLNKAFPVPGWASAQPWPQTPPAPQLLPQPLPLRVPAPDAGPHLYSPSPRPLPPSCFPTSHGGWFALAASLPPAAMTSGAGKSQTRGMGTWPGKGSMECWGPGQAAGSVHSRYALSRQQPRSHRRQTPGPDEHPDTQGHYLWTAATQTQSGHSCSPQTGHPCAIRPSRWPHAPLHPEPRPHLGDRPVQGPQCLPLPLHSFPDHPPPPLPVHFLRSRLAPSKLLVPAELITP